MLLRLTPLVLLVALPATSAEEIRSSAAERWAADGPGGSPSFTRHVVPLLGTLGCSNRTCHGSFQGQAGFRLSLFGYDPDLDHGELTNDAESDGKSRIDVADPDASLILRKGLGAIPHDGGERFEEGSWQHRLLRRWIADGAPYDAATEPTLEQVEPSPAEAVLAPGQGADLRVVAHFSDGTREDVTPLTSFETGDDSVADVSPAGRLTAGEHGDTHVVASYGGGVVTTRVFVPRPAVTTTAPFEPHNRIDELVAAKLRKIGIDSSGLCTDEEFVRRVHVNLIGTLPTADEVRRFLADDRPDKRRRLVDDLLERPEYAAFWATILSDWIGNDQLNLNSFFKVATLEHQWLEQRFLENTPWDEFVGRILTATSREGRTLEEYLAENEAVAAQLEPREGFDLERVYARRRTLDLFWLKRGSDRDKSLATRAANAFLGVSIQCAECHKHPFDRWTQDDFEGFVSFFRGVDITDLDGSERSGGRYDYDKVALNVGPNRQYRRAYEEHPPKLLGETGPLDVGGTTDGATEYLRDPRVDLWEWMRSPRNRYFAANIANRLWAHHTGRGLVDPVDDVSAANPPSNPELLEWLAADFVAHRFDLKHLHRRILNSRTYQLSIVPNDSNRLDRRNHARAIPRRMRAEVALDALARVTGTSLRFNGYAAPPGTTAIGLAAPTRYGPTEYFLATFGRGERQQICSCDRTDDPALAQALFLINDEDVQARLTAPDNRLGKLLQRLDDDDAVIEELYLTALARRPTAAERDSVREHFATAASRREAAEDLLWSLINVREFLFVK